MSDLSCDNCGKNATVGYCQSCEDADNVYCASLRNRIKELEAELDDWKGVVERLGGVVIPEIVDALGGDA